MKLQQVL